MEKTSSVERFVLVAVAWPRVPFESKGRDRDRQRQTETDIGTCIHMYTPCFPGNIDPILYHFVQVFSRA